MNEFAELSILQLQLKEQLLPESHLKRLILPHVFLDEEKQEDLQGQVGALPLPCPRI